MAIELPVAVEARLGSEVARSLHPLGLLLPEILPVLIIDQPLLIDICVVSLSLFAG